MKNYLKLGSMIAVSAVAVIGFSSLSFASVAGSCSTCHTMHNSQDGGNVSSSTGASWSGGQIQGGSSTAENATLLTTDCVGCHSNTGSETILTVGSTQIPIVYNTGGYPVNSLAGGNFAEVNADHTKGHNVYGISPQDTHLSVAPGNFDVNGNPAISCGAATCHTSLALSPSETIGRVATGEPNGCQGCHQAIKHHGTDPAAGQPENANSGWYRFLGSPAGHFGGAGVAGIEDSDWEATTSASDHNIYSGESSEFSDPQSIGKYCAGCHASFHAAGYTSLTTAIDNSSGGGSPWIRHPANFAIPNTGEYAGVIGAAYNPLVPVGKVALPPTDGATVQSGDQVICLSCHRAHGSQYSDMLRWNPADVVAHSSATGTNITGCFYCHRTKDDA